MTALNDWLTGVGVKITKVVGTMWCAIVFAAIALISLPAAISSGSAIVIVAWVAQTFLQLVLLSIIMVGQAHQADTVHAHIHEVAKSAEKHHAKIAAIHTHLGLDD